VLLKRGGAETMSWSLLGTKCEACGQRTRDAVPAPAGAGVAPETMICPDCAARFLADIKKAEAEARAAIPCGVCGKRTREAVPMPGGASADPPPMVCPSCAIRLGSARADAKRRESKDAKRRESEDAGNVATDTVMRWKWPGNAAPQGGDRDRNENPAKALATDLFRAADSEDDAAVRALLAAGADVNSRDGRGRTVLCLACRRNRLGVVQTLISAGADVNAGDTLAQSPYNAGMTPLHWAAGRGHTGVLEVLLANKANIGARDNEGLTPLHTALESCPANLEQVLKMLLAAGADINATTNLGFTPLRMAATAAASKNRPDLPDLVRNLGGHE